MKNINFFILAATLILLASLYYLFSDSFTKSNTENTGSISTTNPEAFPEYKYNEKGLYQWIKNYPNTKDKLIEVATSEDPYSQIEATVSKQPIHEAQQEKYGALRVMALQALLDEEINIKKKYENLALVAEKAKDPVIRKIALSIVESYQKGRDYEKDLFENENNGN